MVAQSYGAGDAILELAHISWPFVLQETFHRARSDLNGFSRRVAIEEAVHQLRNIGSALAQAGKMDRYDVQAKIKVLAKCSRAISRFEFAVRRRDDANIHGNFVVASHGPNFLLLQNAQQLRLQLERQLANFVQENRSAIRGLKKSSLGLQCAGECALLMTKKLAFHQRRDQRTAVHGNKWHRTPAARENEWLAPQALFPCRFRR